MDHRIALQVFSNLIAFKYSTQKPKTNDGLTITVYLQTLIGLFATNHLDNK